MIKILTFYFCILCIGFLYAQPNNCTVSAADIISIARQQDMKNFITNIGFQYLSEGDKGVAYDKCNIFQMYFDRSKNNEFIFAAKDKNTISEIKNFAKSAYVFTKSDDSGEYYSSSDFILGFYPNGEGIWLHKYTKEELQAMYGNSQPQTNLNNDKSQTQNQTSNEPRIFKVTFQQLFGQKVIYFEFCSTTEDRKTGKVRCIRPYDMFKYEIRDFAFFDNKLVITNTISRIEGVISFDKNGRNILKNVTINGQESLFLGCSDCSYLIFEKITPSELESIKRLANCTHLEPCED